MIYGLELENGKYYVGYSRNVIQRIQDHVSARDNPGVRNRDGRYLLGSCWTRRHPVKQILFVEKGERLLENQRTLELMLKHGYHNVRGGKWCYPKMKWEPTELKKFRERSYGPSSESSGSQSGC